jgi:hypothetical protein
MEPGKIETAFFHAAQHVAADVFLIGCAHESSPSIDG